MLSLGSLIVVKPRVIDTPQNAIDKRNLFKLLVPSNQASVEIKSAEDLRAYDV